MDRDLFVEFVDRIAAGLDEPGVSGVELARQAYLSRFHFERVITALAGESPTRFRRRILLERAAYRMIGTETPLVDIAIGAGFGSHEAFTRAFRRAYGMAPSVWRRRPGGFRIDAPSGVHFHPPGGLRLPARCRMGSVDLVVRMVEHHIWVIEQLVERAGRLSDEQLDSPFAGPVEGIDGDSLRWALSRLIGQMAMWNAAMADREYDFGVERDESVSSMRRRLAETGPEYLARVREVAEQDRFDETFVDAFGAEPMVLTYGEMVAHVLTFAAHHRLIAVAKLREFGITDLGYADPKVWLAPGLH